MIVFFTLHPGAWILSCALFGLLIGSFLNVVIYRLPILLERQWCLPSTEKDATKRHPEFNLAWPRSLCTRCGNTLASWQNIPLLSFLFQKGRCHYCQQRISWQYPLVEVLTALIASWLAYRFSMSVQTMLIFCFFSIALVLTVIDMQKGLLPDILNYLLLWLGLFISIFTAFISPTEAILGAMMGYLSLWAIYWLFKLATKKESMGHGDFKLCAAVGAWVGWQALTLVILFSALFGLSYALFQITQGRAQRDTQFAFGPYLAFSGFIVLVFKEPIMRLFY